MPAIDQEQDNVRRIYRPRCPDGFHPRWHGQSSEVGLMERAHYLFCVSTALYWKFILDPFLMSRGINHIAEFSSEICMCEGICGQVPKYSPDNFEDSGGIICPFIKIIQTKYFNSHGPKLCVNHSPFETISLAKNSDFFGGTNRHAFF